MARVAAPQSSQSRSGFGSAISVAVGYPSPTTLSVRFTAIDGIKPESGDPAAVDFARAMGVLYYTIYSSRRRRKPKLEVHKLINGVYQLQSASPVWMPEIGLGIGYERGNYAGVTREWLYWYNEAGQRYPTPNERVQQEAQRATISEQRAEQLAQRLRELGVDPDAL